MAQYQPHNRVAIRFLRSGTVLFERVPKVSGTVKDALNPHIPVFKAIKDH